MSYQKEVFNDTEEMLAAAEARGLWVQSPYQDIWWSPAELRAAQSQGRFRWGPDNFTLRDPEENLARINRQIAALKAEREAFSVRIARAK